MNNGRRFKRNNVLYNVSDLNCNLSRFISPQKCDRRLLFIRNYGITVIFFNNRLFTLVCFIYLYIQPNFYQRARADFGILNLLIVHGTHGELCFFCFVRQTNTSHCYRYVLFCLNSPEPSFNDNRSFVFRSDTPPHILAAILQIHFLEYRNGNRNFLKIEMDIDQVMLGQVEICLTKVNCKSTHIERLSSYTILKRKVLKLSESSLLFAPDSPFFHLLPVVCLQLQPVV